MKSRQLNYLMCIVLAAGLTACGDDSHEDTATQEQNIATCGNGRQEEDETCDDGNTKKGDGCSDNCTVEAGWKCDAPGEPCVEDSVMDESACGDGKVNGSESCDDGNTSDGDGCTKQCDVEAGWKCEIPGEPCVEDSVGDESVCGDGKLTGSESCDDGNKENGDGCTADCAVESGWKCEVPGEPCVEDSVVDESVCGDGKVTGSESCDDGNTEDGDGCSKDCAVESGWKCEVPGEPCVEDDIGDESVCGDGKVTGSESCDDGNTEDGDGCTKDCAIESGWKCEVPGEPCAEDIVIEESVCGDGKITGSESCDDGNKKGGDGCSAKCVIEDGWICSEVGKPCVTVCGDGLLANVEECDDGNKKDGDGCSKQCIIEEAWLCNEAGKPCVPEFDDKKSIKILGLGNSFMVNSTVYLADILKDMGYTDVKVGVIYSSGKSINWHAENIRKNGTYDHYYVNGKYDDKVKPSYLDVIKSEKWDYFIIQTYPPNVPDLYNHDIDYVLNLVRTNAQKLPVFGWSMTWALQLGKPHAHLVYAGYYPQKMYEGTVLAVNNKIVPRKDIPIVIPVGTAIENMRHGIFADNVTKDGYHVSPNNGQFAACMMWAKQITKRPVGKLTFKPKSYSYTDRQYAAIKEAVINAYKTPYSVTTPKKGVLGSYLKKNKELQKVFADAGHKLEDFVEVPVGVTTNAMYNATTMDEDVKKVTAAHKDLNTGEIFCYSAMLSAETGSKNKELKKHAASRIFNRFEIPSGSFIVLKSGYEYRPEGWISLLEAVDSKKRPAVTDAAITEVTDAWWGDFKYRAFTLSQKGAPDLNDKDMEKLESAMSIFIPIEHDNADAAMVKAGYDLSKYKKLDLSLANEVCWDSNHDSDMPTETNKTMPGSTNVFPTKLFSAGECPKYAATRIFSKEEIPNGSVIVVRKGYRYIPDAWIDLDISNKNKNRKPKSVIAKDADSIIVVDDAWWGEFKYRGFDIAKETPAKVTPLEQRHFGEIFAIYTPL